MNPEQKRQIIYDTAVSVLLEMRGMLPGDLADCEEYYFTPKRRRTLNEVLERFAVSAQNARGFPNVIGLNNETRERELRNEFHEYDVAWVKEKMDPESMGNTLWKRYSPEVRTSNPRQNTWVKWAWAIKDSAALLANYQDASGFYADVESYLGDVENQANLAFHIARNVKGFGFALACDALKELGFTSYAKPDVHIKVIFRKLGLLPPIISEDKYWNKAQDWLDYQVFKQVSSFAGSCHEFGDVATLVTPYKVDKVMWLVSTGNFYNRNDPVVDKKSHREKFIQRAKEQLEAYRVAEA